MLLKGSRLPLKRMAVGGVRSIGRNFQQEGRPKKWEALKKSPSRVKKKGRHKILQDKRRLMKSVKHKVLGFNNFKVYTGLHYAGVHQFGYSKGNIPARPFMLWQKEDADALASIVANYLAKV